MAYDVCITAVIINLDPYHGVTMYVEELARSHWPRGVVVHFLSKHV